MDEHPANDSGYPPQASGPPQSDTSESDTSESDTSESDTSESDATSSDADGAARAWQPLSPIERRVVGVLVEKAKTVPESYPLTLNALRAGCNQKSNRAPQMQLDQDQLEETLERLRGLGAVMEVQGDGRVPKYRHSMYEWLGVEKDELAVMAELLLRGPQTIGELRGRAARMERIASLAELRPILDALIAKQLAIYLTPPGRGCTVTHNLYPSEERARLPQQPTMADAPMSPTAASRTANSSSSAATQGPDPVASLRAELDELRRELTATTDRLTRDVAELHERLGESLRS